MNVNIPPKIELMILLTFRPKSATSPDVATRSPPDVAPKACAQSWTNQILWPNRFSAPATTDAEAVGVLGIAECVRRDDGAGSRRDRIRNPFWSRVVVVERDVDKHWGVAAQGDCVRDDGTGVRGHHHLGVANADCLEERPLGGAPVCERNRVRSAELRGKAPLEVRNPMPSGQRQGNELPRPERNAEPRNHRSTSSCSCQYPWLAMWMAVNGPLDWRRVTTPAGSAVSRMVRCSPNSITRTLRTVQRFGPVISRLTNRRLKNSRSRLIRRKVMAPTRSAANCQGLGTSVTIVRRYVRTISRDRSTSQTASSSKNCVDATRPARS